MKVIDPEKAKFVAEVRNVRELRLIGNVGLDFWNKQLSGKPFQPLDREGFAEITIAATELIWKSFKFNELTISLAVAAMDDPLTPVGYLLLTAMNSNRFFAFCERTFFSTPYYFGQVDLRETAPCLLTARSNDQTVLNTEMSGATRPITEEEETWEGVVFLPKGSGEKYFIAKLSGRSKNCPFIETDKINIQSHHQQDVFELLVNSGFSAKEWRMRSRAFHAKSKTYHL